MYHASPQRFLPGSTIRTANPRNHQSFPVSNDIPHIRQKLGTEFADKPLRQAPLPNLPTNFGVLLFPAFQALDIFGPLDALNLLSTQFVMNLTLISSTMDPVSTAHHAMKPISTFSETINPTHTFANAPPLDVLIVPGGMGTRDKGLENHIAFIKNRFPTVKYLLTVCTGSGLAARAGVLDGRKATTNKKSWNETVALGPKVKWQAQARWVVDKHVWSSSGVSAGIDMTLAWIGKVFGTEAAEWTANGMEYEREFDSRNDPFYELYDL